MHVLVLRLALNHMKSRPLSRAVVILSMATILLMNAMVFLLFQSFSRSLAEVRASKFMTAYLDSSIAPAKEAEVLSAVKKIPGVSSAQLVSKEAFIENFSRYFPQLSSELSGLDSDTIPRYVKVKVNGESALVQDQLQRMRGIEMVELNKNRFAGLIGALSTLRKLALVLMAGMSTALLCILFNHFKLGTAFQAQVRQTLRALGARGGLVYLPFAIEGLIEGAAGGVLAATALLVYGRAFESQLGGFFTAIGYHPYHFEVGYLAQGLVAIGMLSGLAGSLWATRRA